MGHRIAVTALCVLLCPYSAAATRYVTNSGAGTEDGSSEANAFAGCSDVNLSDGDALVVVGRLRCTITVVNSDITVTGTGGSEAGEINGADVISGWSGPDGNGEYSKSGLTTEVKVVAIDGVIQTKGTNGSLGAGEFDWDSNVLYIKDNPTGKTVEAGQRNFCVQIGSIGNEGIQNVTVSDLTIKYCNKDGISIGADSWTNNSLSYGSLTVDNIDFFGVREQAVHQDSGDNCTSQSYFDSIEIKNSTVLENGGEAFYLRECAKYVSVHDNVIGSDAYNNFGWDRVTGASSYKGDGVDMGGTHGSDVRVYDNEIVNIRGNGVSLSTPYARVWGNTIRDAYETSADATGSRVAAIKVDPDSAGLVEVFGNNIKQTLGDGVILRGAAASDPLVVLNGNLIWLTSAVDAGYAAIHHTATNASGVKIYWNTLIGGQYGWRVPTTAEATPSIEVINNIAFDSAYPIYFQKTTTSSLTVNKNITYDSGDQANPYLMGNTAYASVSAMQAAHATVTNGIEQDPLFTSSTSFRLQAASPGIDTAAGINRPCKSVDGPCLGTYDIGAYQDQFVPYGYTLRPNKRVRR